MLVTNFLARGQARAFAVSGSPPSAISTAQRGWPHNHASTPGRSSRMASADSSSETFRPTAPRMVPRSRPSSACRAPSSSASHSNIQETQLGIVTGSVSTRSRSLVRRAPNTDTGAPLSLAASKTLPPPSPSAGRSSPGTTPSTAMPGSRCSPPMMSIITEHRMCWLSADVPCKPPGPFTPNASSTAPRNPPRFPKPSGSTHPPLPQQEKRVSK